MDFPERNDRTETEGFESEDPKLPRFMPDTAFKKVDTGVHYDFRTGDEDEELDEASTQTGDRAETSAPQNTNDDTGEVPGPRDVTLPPKELFRGDEPDQESFDLEIAGEDEPDLPPPAASVSEALPPPPAPEPAPVPARPATEPDVALPSPSQPKAEKSEDDAPEPAEVEDKGVAKLLRKKKQDLTPEEKKRIKREERRQKREARRMKERKKAEERRRKELKKEEARKRRKQKREQRASKLSLTNAIGPVKAKLAPFGKKLKHLNRTAFKRSDEPKVRKQSSIEKAFQQVQNKLIGMMRRNVIGLDIGGSRLRAVRSQGGIPVRLAERDLPPGVIVDGVLEDPETLAEEIKDFWKDEKLRSKKVNFSLSSRLLMIRTQNLAARYEADIPHAVAMNAERFIAPLDPKENVMDYTKLSRSGQQHTLQIAAIDKDVVKEYVKAIEKAGLIAVSSEAGPLAAARSIVVPRSPNSRHALIGFGAELSWFAVGNGPDIFSLRFLETAGNDLTRAVQEEFNISFTEAEQLKIRCGVADTPADPTVDDLTFRRCKQAMRPVLDRLLKEIAQTKAVWDSENAAVKIKGWTMLGGGSRMNGLTEEILRYTDFDEQPVMKPMPDFENIEDLGAWATAIGLSCDHQMSLLPSADPTTRITLPGMRRRSKISLKRSQKEGKKLTRSNATKQLLSPKVMALMASALLLGGGFYYKTNVTNEINDLTAQIEELEATNLSNAEIGFVPPIYKNSKPATQVMSYLSRMPDPELLLRVDGALHKAELPSATVKSRGTMMIVEGQMTEKQMDALLKDLESTGLFGEPIIDKGWAVEKDDPVDTTINLPVRIR